ncbi:MAG TPA: thioredoxin family protein [Balneolaceae bacterium]|nr:thioredoxin family protein [Balneolaceae bacterium]
MKKIQLSVLICLLGTLTVQAQTALRIGAQLQAADQEIEDTSGRTWTLEQKKDTNGLLVIFSSNTCPWVAKWEDRYNFISTLANINDVGMIVLNPNERIRSRGESLDDMRRRAQKQGYNFTYALDEDHIIADAFGATRTPEVFLFDGNSILVYHGAIDDNADDANSTQKNFLEDALNAIANGEDIPIQQSKLSGCGIKRSE